jgi:aminoglycoside/choline kinase family phosphotransferase
MYYCELQAEAGTDVGENFERVFWQCAVQRLMQALGAYGFLSIHRGKPAFRAHVTPALIRLREALASLHPDDRLNDLEALVSNLNQTLKFHRD